MFEDDNIEENKYKKFRHFHYHDLTTEEEVAELDAEVKEYYEWITNNSSVPYLVTLSECEEKNMIGENNGRYNDLVLQTAVTKLLDNINGTPITQKTLTDVTQNTLDNDSYHCCKIMYLIDQYRTVGLDSTMQAITENIHMFVHPGMSRIHALWYLKARAEKIVMWDNVGHFKNKAALRYEEWRDIFTVEGKTVFFANVDGNILEVHMQEDRPSIAGCVDLIREMFDWKRPLLRGKASDDVMSYVRTEGSTGVAIETKNDYTLKAIDLLEILGLYPESVERIEKENFSIYKI